MYISLFLGPNVAGPHEDAKTIDFCLEQAEIADQAGFAAVYVGEQHFNNYEPYADPFPILGYLAGRLKQAYLGTSVIPVAVHHPLRLVERMNSVDQLCKGRVVFGLSSGEHPHVKLAFPPAEGTAPAAQLFEERLAVMHQAWNHKPEDGPFDYRTSAEHGTLKGRMMPFSYRDAHPLYAVGTNTPAKIAQAGRDGRMVHLGPLHIRNGAEIVRLYRAAMEEAGHPEDLIRRNLAWMIHTKGVFVGDDDASAREQAGPFCLPRLRAMPIPGLIMDPTAPDLDTLLKADPGEPATAMMAGPETEAAFIQRCNIAGGADTVARDINAFAEAGMEHMHIRFAVGSMENLDPFRRSLDLFVEKVMPRIAAQQFPALQPHEVRPMYRD